MKILVLNSGSSSQKNCLYDIGNTLPAHPPAPAWEGKIEWNGDHADIQAQNSQGVQLKDRVKVASRSDAIECLLDTLWSGKLRVLSAPSEIDAVGHRVVHGGKSLQEATAITPEVKSAIARMSVFAPLHNRAELEGIEIIEKRIGGQVRSLCRQRSLRSIVRRRVRKIPIGPRSCAFTMSWSVSSLRRSYLSTAR